MRFLTVINEKMHLKITSISSFIVAKTTSVDVSLNYLLMLIFYRTKMYLSIVNILAFIVASLNYQLV